MLLNLVLASILIPFIGAVLTLLIPRGWVKVFSQITAFLAFLASLFVLIELGRLGKVSLTIDLFPLSDLVVFGVTIDKLSSLIGLAVILVGFLIVVYSSGYLSSAEPGTPRA